MSRFFAASDSESESSSGDEELVQRPAVTAKTFQWSDDDEETKRVVRSAKDKRYEELENIITALKNSQKIKDMSKLLSEFERLTKAYDKAKKVVDKEGIPRFYIRCLSELQDFVTMCWEDRAGRNAMAKSNAKSLTALRQKLKKYTKDFEMNIANYKEHPDKEDELKSPEDSADEEEVDEEQRAPADVFKKTTPAKPEPTPADDESDDSMFWGSDSESDSDSDMDESKYEGNLAEMFLKKTTDKDDKKVKKERKEKKKIQIEDEDDDGEGNWEEVNRGIPAVAERPKMFSKDAEINHEKVLKKLFEIVGARGKKGTDRTGQVELLKELRSIANANNLGNAMDTKILLAICGAIYDYNPNIATCMKADMWEKCLMYIQELQDQVINNPDIIIGENVSEESENYGGEAPFRIRGCMLTVVERLDEEYIKMLQACDAHSTEYIERLKDERTLCKIIEDLQTYMEDRATSEEICRIYIKRVEHLYYKFEKPTTAEEGKEEVEGSEAIMDRLCKFIYVKDNTDRIRTRTILYHIYHHALHDRWYQARDLMLMSHLQDTIERSDIPTQIIYNRALVQLGLCAFRAGMIRDAHNNLVDIQSGGRAKELLAQGLLLQRQHDRTPEQEKIEKRRQMPYHMHINLELLECVYLVSAMLLEIPYMAAHEFDARRRMISKNFHHVLRTSERQPLVGPPESMREHVVAASKAMKRGDWKSCTKFIINDKMNAKVWELFHDKDTVRSLIRQKIQEESLRTYLFTYSFIYDSLRLETLAEMFELETHITHSIISKMILNEELMASLDQPTQSVVMHRTEPTRLQSLSLQLSEKVSNLLDNNERLNEAKHGNFSFIKQGQQGGYQHRGDNQRFQNRYNRDNQQGGGRGYHQRGGRGGYKRDQEGGGGGREGGNRYWDNQNRGRGGRREQRDNRY